MEWNVKRDITSRRVAPQAATFGADPPPGAPGAADRAAALSAFAEMLTEVRVTSL